MTASAQIGVHALPGELERAASALATFDLQALEATEERIRLITARHLAGSRDLLPKLMERQAFLGQMLAATEANLKVLVSVLNLPSTTRPYLERKTETL